jgi:hypothetical protein
MTNRRWRDHAYSLLDYIHYSKPTRIAPNCRPRHLKISRWPRDQAQIFQSLLLSAESCELEWMYAQCPAALKDSFKHLMEFKITGSYFEDDADFGSGNPFPEANFPIEFGNNLISANMELKDESSVALFRRLPSSSPKLRRLELAGDFDLTSVAQVLSLFPNLEQIGLSDEPLIKLGVFSQKRNDASAAWHKLRVLLPARFGETLRGVYCNSRKGYRIPLEAVHYLSVSENAQDGVGRAAEKLAEPVLTFGSIFVIRALGDRYGVTGDDMEISYTHLSALLKRVPLSATFTIAVSTIDTDGEITLTTTVLHALVKYGMPSEVQSLFQESPLRVADVVDSLGFTPLHYCPRHMKSWQYIQTFDFQDPFRDQNMLLNSQNVSGLDPLSHIVRSYRGRGSERHTMLGICFSLLDSEPDTYFTSSCTPLVTILLPLGEHEDSFTDFGSRISDWFTRLEVGYSYFASAESLGLTKPGIAAKLLPVVMANSGTEKLINLMLPMLSNDEKYEAIADLIRHDDHPVKEPLTRLVSNGFDVNYQKNGESLLFVAANYLQYDAMLVMLNDFDADPASAAESKQPISRHVVWDPECPSTRITVLTTVTSRLATRGQAHLAAANVFSLSDSFVHQAI